MQQIPLSAVANQTLSFNVDGAYWQLSIYTSISFVCVTITRNGVKIVDGDRCFVGMGLLPYDYMQSPSYGNFIFDAEPDWNNFDDTCNLYYLSEEEYAAFKLQIYEGVTSADINASD